MAVFAPPSPGHRSVEEPRGLQRLWRRELSHYPAAAQRYLNLGITVLATVILYYELYVNGAVATSIIADLHMSFLYFVGILVVANAVGALASVLTEAGDRFGRANLVTYGLLIAGLLTLGVEPHVHSKLAFGVTYALIGIVEGVVLVATPALVRDFSPQLGRASAMGFWTIGPVAGSLVVSEVSSHTLRHLTAWQDQITICGIVGLVVFVIALVGLRELSPAIRNQIMVSTQDSALIEARAREGVAGGEAKKPFAQVMHLDILASATAISLYLLTYYTAVAFFVIFLQTVQNFSQDQANGLLNYYWASNAISLVVFGVLSDRLHVRKPFMLVGAIGSIITAFFFLQRTTHANASYSSYALLFVLTGVYGGAVFAPWMASFTESVERRNPALIATGLSVWGGILRTVVAISFLLLPKVITSVTPLVQDGPRAIAISAQYPGLVATLSQPKAAAAVQAVSTYTDPATIPPQLATNLVEAIGAENATLLTNPKVAADIKELSLIAPGVQKAQADAPGQWKNWFYVGLGGQLVFLLLIPLMSGPWSPRRARQEVDEYERGVDAEFAALTGQMPGPRQGLVHDGHAGHDGHDRAGALVLPGMDRGPAGRVSPTATTSEQV